MHSARQESEHLRAQAEAAWSKIKWRDAPAMSTRTPTLTSAGHRTNQDCKVVDKAETANGATEWAATAQALPLSTQSDFAALQIHNLPLDSSGLAMWPRCDIPHPSKNGGAAGSDSDSDPDSEDEHAQPNGGRRNLVRHILSALQQEQAARRVLSSLMHDDVRSENGITISSAFGEARGRN